MRSGDMTGVCIVLALFLLSAGPHLLFGEVPRRRFMIVDAAISALFVAGSFLVMWRSAPIDPEPFFAWLLVLKTVALLFFWSTAEDGAVRWSAGLAAAFAGIVYLLLVPNMIRVPIDGDEPFYVLATESLVHDGDLDLRNQFQDMTRSLTGRPDLRPQLGDPVGSEGEQYSRHQPLLSILLIPGYLLGGLAGCVVTIALLGMLLVRSTMRFFEEEGISARTSRFVFPFFAIGPPLIDYSVRIWPEVPAALFLVEAIRGARQRRWLRFGSALLGLGLLKLRFVLIAAMLILAVILSNRRDWKKLGAVMAAVAIPFALIWFAIGHRFNVHEPFESFAGGPSLKPLRGLFGLLVDGQGGILFQAPFYLLALFAIARCRKLSPGLRIGLWSASLYLLLLFPRSEWHGGWSPPLRYIVVFMPVLALAAAHLLERFSLPTTRALIALWTTGLLVHGVAYPWRKFHTPNGESLVGEFVSSMYHRDFSRMVPSFIRTNDAAIAASWMLVVLLMFTFIVGRLDDRVAGLEGRMRLALPGQLVFALLALLVAGGVATAAQPGRSVDFEDSHVIHKGGDLYPPLWTVARFRFRGGWWMGEGDESLFQFGSGPAVLYYQSESGCRISIDGSSTDLGPSGPGFGTRRILIAKSGRIRLQVVSGRMIADRIEHE